MYFYFHHENFQSNIEVEANKYIFEINWNIKLKTKQKIVVLTS